MASKPPFSPEHPPTHVLQRILEDFVELHGFSLQYAAGASIKLAGGVGLFDFAKHTLLLDICYRPDNGGNSAKAFRFVGHQMLPADELDNLSPVREYADASQEFTEEARRWFKANDDLFLGFFDVLWLVDGVLLKPDSVEVSDNLWSIVATGPTPEHWYTVLKRLIESGVVM